ncbi:LuxR C-terminal-related transcriptional regulator [Pseudomonas lundensis]|uniref:LuxR C-terminal-related transcriptional regulator n=1 Tax=Serratia proteamaculans TaxID=28151 RepID=UPI002980BE6B|nr:LuxR C-terminal-related transcriptional regulator [Serratia proteamaculans]MDW5498654.1 LuxR C-terminal-related transcriptional regulator [Serratia proteamaculans]MDW5503712.1 LuxR C-terminal-related transcriptional regulator [Pseudomonas lundensis]
MMQLQIHTATGIRDGEPTRSPLLPPQLAARLTPNERIIMQGLLSGQELTTIAWRLHRDIRTISSHKQRAMARLALTSNAMLYALGALLNPPLPEDISARRQLLAPREEQVLRALLNGYCVTDIARQQGRSVKTISYQKCQLMQKLGLKSDVGLFALDPQQARALMADWSGWSEPAIEG